MASFPYEFDYKTNYPNLGIALIINQSFSNNLDDFRPGSKEDERLFVDSLLKLGFKNEDIIVKNDLTQAEIRDELHSVAKKVDHSKNALFLCAMFTHGVTDFLYTANNYLLPVSDLWKNFTNSECPSLKGKPKIFFIEACRGEKLDSGVKITFTTFSEKITTNPINLPMDSTDSKKMMTLSPYQLPMLPRLRYNSENLHEDLEKVDISKRRRSLPLNSPKQVPKSWYESPNSSPSPKSPTTVDFPKSLRSTDLSPQKKKILPFCPTHFHPDLLVATSSASGYFSFHNEVSGSWFVKAWHDVITECDKLDKVDIAQLLTLVNCKVAEDRLSFSKGDKNDKKQIPNFNSTLTKRLYFKTVN